MHPILFNEFPRARWLRDIDFGEKKTEFALAEIDVDECSIRLIYSCRGSSVRLHT